MDLSGIFKGSFADPLKDYLGIFFQRSVEGFVGLLKDSWMAEGSFEDLWDIRGILWRSIVGFFLDFVQDPDFSHLKDLPADSWT